MGSRQFSFIDTQGREKAKVVDIFGSWKPYDTLGLADAGSAKLPNNRVSRADILLMNVELDSESQIPFSAFDHLRNEHNIDVSAISLSLTHRGNLYRAHVLQRC